MSEREEFKRNSLRGIKNEKRYINKMEHIIVDEGKRILNGLRASYRIVSQKDITKFLDAHPEFKEAFNKKTTWHQIHLQWMYDTHVITTYQHRILIMTKQILNKHSSYILRSFEFENRYYVMQCEWYPKTEKCLRDQCKASENCPHYHKNFETKHEKYGKLAEAYRIKKEKK